MKDFPAPEAFAPLSWEQLPGLDLYMDQVITLVGGQIDLLSAGIDRPLTSSMINNYVKDGVMPRPVQKKYNREHLAVLCIICMLKTQFTLPEIRRLLEGLGAYDETEQLYAAFCDTQAQAMQDTALTLADVDALDEAERYRLAMQLALEANVRRVAATRLLAALSPAEEEKATKKDKKK